MIRVPRRKTPRLRQNFPPWRVVFGYLLIFVIGASFTLFNNSHVSAFTGPTTGAGVGGGAVRTDTSNNVSVGAGPSANTKFLIQAPDTSASNYSLRILQPDGITPLFLVRNDNKMAVGAQPSSTVLTVGGDIWTTGTIYAAAVSAPLSGTINAANVSSGVFGSNTGFGNFTFGTSTNPVLHIDNTNARVGIGTTGPAARLHVNGGQTYLVYDHVSTPALDVRNGGGGPAAVFGATGGNVGIGTTGPTWLLNLYKDSSSGAAGAYPAVMINNPNAAGFASFLFYNGVTQLGGMEGNTATGNIMLYTGTTKSLLLNPNGGNVGIGTTGPGVLLQVQKTVVSAFPTLGTASGNVALIGNGGLWGMYLGLEDSGAGWIQQMRNNSATAYNLSLQPVGGNVGIGTTGPGYRLVDCTNHS